MPGTQSIRTGLCVVRLAVDSLVGSEDSNFARGPFPARFPGAVFLAPRVRPGSNRRFRRSSLAPKPNGREIKIRGALISKAANSIQTLHESLRKFAPPLAAPCQALGESVDLIVVAPGK